MAVFNYDSFTTAIYKSWLDFGSLATATQLASLLFLFAMAMMLAGQYAGRRARHHAGGARMPRMQLRPALRLAACGFCTLVFALAVALPLLQLLAWVLSGVPALRPGALVNSLLLAAATSLGLVFLALCFLAAPRGRSRVLGEVCGLGYALPGSVLAVAVLILLGWVDGLLGAPLLLGSAAGLILAYMVRFFRLGHGPLAASMEQIPPCLHEAAATLGASPWRRLHAVVAPLLGRGLAVALLLVFVEVLKEMPATLLLRPFGLGHPGSAAVRLDQRGPMAAGGLAGPGAGVRPAWCRCCCWRAHHRPGTAAPIDRRPCTTQTKTSCIMVLMRASDNPGAPDFASWTRHIMSNEFDKTLSGMVGRDAPAQAAEILGGLLQPEQYVGEVFHIAYESAKIQIHDHARRKVGGVPALGFLLATRLAPDAQDINPDDEDSSIILLRVMDAAELPDARRAEGVRVEVARNVSGEADRHWDSNEAMDADYPALAGVRWRGMQDSGHILCGEG